MPMKCCIPGCTSNYNGTEGYVKIFGVPNNPIRRQAWVESIPRENWTPTKSSFVCIKHFKKEYILMGRQRWKLTDNAVPTIFPEVTRATAKRYRNVKKPQCRTSTRSDANASRNDYNREIPESVGDFCTEIVYCEVEDSSLQIKEEPTTINDSAIDSLDLSRSDVVSCEDSAYEETQNTAEYTAASESADFYRFDLLGQYWTEKMRSLQTEQRIFAEKLINDVLFEAELGRLSHEWYLANQ